jgi:hypothetical protein
MSKPLRSPLLGYNHNLTHLERVFHIQTEDSGPLSPRLFTHLFFEGTILASRKCEYDPSLPDDKVRGLMQTQHKTVMKDLVRARLDGIIVPFFAARGEELVPIQGAMPTAVLSATPGPVLVLPEDTEGDGRITEETADSMNAPAAAASPDEPRAPARAGGAAPAGPRRTSTRPLEAFAQRGPTPPPPVVHAPESRRNPFVRHGSPSAPRMSSTDGVVVQRNLVVGGEGPSSSSRPARIRPPVPYVVTGGGHTERPPKPNPGPTGLPPLAGSGGTPIPHAPLAAGIEPLPRAPGGIGLELADDKSLDEVILEYLSEDGETD